MSKHVVKSKTYIVHQNGHFRQPTILGRFRVGARDPNEAMELLRKKLGKHISCRVYYEVMDPKLYLSHGEVIREV